MENSIILEIGSEANGLQVYIDETQARFSAIFWPTLLNRRPSRTLTYESISGSRKAGIAANVVSYNVSAPLHSRQALSKASGDIPSMRGKRAMSEKDLYDYLAARASGMANVNDLLDLIYDDVAWASVAPHKRIDWMCGKMISTGKITLDIDNNSAGIATVVDIDFMIPDANKSGTVGAVWSNAADSTPLTDLATRFFLPMADQGITGGVIRMHPSKVFQLLASAEVLDKFSALSQGRVNSLDLSLATVNGYLASNNFPTIRPFNASIGIEKDGIVTYENPFAVDNVVWTPEGQIGTLHVAPVIERLRPQPQVRYGSYLDNLVKKYSNVDPVTEFTAFEMNAIPTLDVPDQVRILNTNNVDTFE